MINEIKKFNKFFELYHHYNNWGDLYYYTQTLQNPYPEKINQSIFELYKNGMACWCKLMYSIWLGDKEKHLVFLEELDKIYRELCYLTGIDYGQEIFTALGLQEEDEQGDMPKAFDIIYSTAFKNGQRQRLINQMLQDIENVNLNNASPLEDSFNNIKLKEFISYYQKIQKKEGRLPRKHRIIKFLLFKKIDYNNFFSMSGSREFKQLNIDSTNSFCINGLFNCTFNAIVSFHLEDFKEIVSLKSISENFLFCKMIIDFQYTEIYKTYLWSSLFDEDILLQFNNDKNIFSPLFLHIFRDGQIYKRIREFNYTLHIAEHYDPSLLNSDKGSFIPFNIDDVNAYPDNGIKRFIINQQMVIYVKPRGHDTELELSEKAVNEFLRYMSVLWILVNENYQLILGKSKQHSIMNIKTAFVEMNSKIKYLTHKLDLNCRFLLEYFNLAYDNEYKQTVSGKIKHIEALLSEQDSKARSKIEMAIFFLAIIQSLGFITGIYSLLLSKGFFELSGSNEIELFVVAISLSFLSFGILIVLSIVLILVFQKKYLR